MQIDRYTKVVLTIIAGALVVVAAENAMKQAQAQTQPGVMKVAICSEDGSRCTGVSEYWDKSARLLVMPPH
jgi:hypothetical protein